MRTTPSGIPLYQGPGGQYVTVPPGPEPEDHEPAGYEEGETHGIREALLLVALRAVAGCRKPCFVCRGGKQIARTRLLANGDPEVYWEPCPCCQGDGEGWEIPAAVRAQVRAALAKAEGATL